MTADRLVLSAGDARLTISPADGGRMTSLVIGGHEVLVTEGYGPIAWGCYPMAPFAGRIRDGRSSFAGRAIDLPLNMPPHAIHGTVFERAWTVDGPNALSIDLGPDWPFAGRADQTFALRPDGLDVALSVSSDDGPMPVSLGWHPWFRRHLGGTAATARPASGAVELAFDAGRMLERGADGLPTGAWTTPGPHPWDDCFTDLVAPPRVSWPGILAIELASSARYWVVYDEQPSGICVEPQTAIPDAVNLDARGRETGLIIAEPGRPATATMTWRWAAA